MIRIKLIGSPIGRVEKQKLIVRSLGLKKMNQIVERPDTPGFRGMVKKVPPSYCRGSHRGFSPTGNGQHKGTLRLTGKLRPWPGLRLGRRSFENDMGIGPTKSK